MDERDYFRSIEERFIQLRGAPLLLSPADYQVAKRWWAEGVPLAVVHGALEEVFARRSERGAGSPVQSLRYCASAVEAAWTRSRELARADQRQTAEPVELAPRLAALAAAIPDLVPEADSWREEVSGIGGDTEEVEAALAELDARLLRAVSESLDPDQRAAVERRVESGLAALGERIAASELESSRGRLFEQAIRRELRLPVLSLFADV